MKKYYLILLLLCTVYTVRAQNEIIGYQYWFNNDSSVQEVTLVPFAEGELLLEIDAGDLMSGLNVIHLQMFDSEGRYSSPVSSFFYGQKAEAISGYKYWFNSDTTGITTVSVDPATDVFINASIDASLLKEGLNVLYFCFFDNLNQHSSTSSHFFYKTKAGTATNKAYQYWFNNDLENAVTANMMSGEDVTMTAEIETAGLTPGLHRFNIRVQDERDLWSSTLSSFVYKPTSVHSEETLITAYEYWLDDDFESRNTVTLETPVNPHELFMEIDMAEMPVGDYVFNYRSRDTRNLWSVVSSHPFHREEIPLMWVDQQQYCDSATVLFFNNTDSLTTSYQWNFGDGQSSDEFEPTHQFSEPGVYEVSLTATDINTMKDTTETILITVGSSFIDIQHKNIEVGDSIEWQGMFYKEAGTYHEFFESSLGCDSIHVLELMVSDSLISAPKDIYLTPDILEENAPAGTLIGHFTAVDIDEDENHVFTLAGGDEQARNRFFYIEDNALYSKQALDFEELDVYTILVEVEDKQGYSYTRFIDIRIIDINEAPDSILLSNDSIAENMPLGSLVASLSTHDQDMYDHFSYHLVEGDGGDDNALFTIDGDKLRTAAVFNFETKASYSIRIEVTDKGGLTYAESFSITIVNRNDAPTAISLSNHMVEENQTSRTLVGVLSTVDQDLDEVFSYAFASGENDIDNGSFQLSGDSLFTSAVFDFEKKSTYFIRISSTDREGAVYSRSFTIVVIDVDENPLAIKDIILSNHAVDENLEGKTLVGKLSTIGGVGPQYLYNFITGDGDYDNLKFIISNDSLYSITSYNFESRSLYFTRIQTMDALGETFSKLMLVLVNDVNESPYALFVPTTTVNEQEPAYTLVSKLISFDEDLEDHHVYSLASGEGDADNNFFVIRNDSLFTKEVLSYKQKPTYSIRIQTTDKGGMSYSMKVTVNLNSINALNEVGGNLNAFVHNDNLVIHASEFNGTTAELYSLSGQLMLKESLVDVESRFRLHDISKGVYLLRITRENEVKMNVKIMIP